MGKRKLIKVSLMNIQGPLTSSFLTLPSAP